MKSVNSLARLALLGFIFFIGCKKNESGQNPIKTAAISSIIDEAKSSFAKLAPIVSGNNAKSLQPTSVKTPIWERAYVSKLKRGQTVVVPLKYDRQIRFETNFGDGKSLSLQQQLFLFMRKRGNSFEVEIVTYLPDKTFLGGRPTRFSGAVLTHDWSGNHTNTFVYRDGKRFKAKKGIGSMASKQDFSSSARMVCYYIDWYDCRENSAGDLFDCVYVSSTFLGCIEEFDEQQEESEIWNDDYAGGGAPDDEDGCGNIAVEMNDAVSNTADVVSITTSNQTSATRTKNYIWVFAKGTFNPSLKWRSHETGVHANDNGTWKWQSLTHNSISKDGVIVGGSLDCAVNSATATVGIYNSIMAINYTFTWSIVCKGSPFSGSVTKTSAKPFNVND